MKLYKKIWGKKIDYVRDSGEIVRNALSKDVKSITIEPETDTMKIIEEMAEHLKEMGNTITSIMGNVKAIKPVLN
jgi:cytochrome oxidase Cu insertion factor (SCO1/SenC/PrrC family)